jgi:hypothetical protein
VVLLTPQLFPLAVNLGLDVFEYENIETSSRAGIFSDTFTPFDVLLKSTSEVR